MSIRSIVGSALLVLFLPAIGAAQAGSAAVPSPGYELAKHAAEAAEAEARANNWNVTITVVDSAGAPVYVKRMDGASARTYDFAIGKSRTVVRTGLSTLEYVQRVQGGQMTALPDATAIEGGLPIMRGGKLVGAIAASGVRPNQDAQVAKAGVDALAGH